MEAVKECNIKRAVEKHGVLITALQDRLR